MKKFKVERIRELPYHYDIVTPYIRYKYMTDILYNRMIEIGFWWYRWEIHYQGGKPGYYFGQFLDATRFLLKIIYYIVIVKTTHYFKKIFKNNSKEQ